MANLIVNDTTPRIQYTALGGQTEFTYPFAIFTDADLKVYLTPNGQTADDTSDILVLTTNYTVSGAGSTNGGNVTLVSAATAGDIVTIERDLPVERTSDYTENGDFTAENFNDDLDKLIMMIQQIESNYVNLAIKIPVTSTTGSVDFPAFENDKYLTTDGSVLVWGTPAGAAGAIGNVLEDVTPQLGGDLDTNENGIAFPSKTITDVLDEDDMASNSDTKLVTQQSLVAYLASQLASAPFSANHRNGFTLSNNSTDSDHDIDIAVGGVRDSADAVNIKLTSALTKQIDASWVAGDDAGGLSSSLTVATSTWYHVFAVVVGGSVDVMFDTSLTCANGVADHSVSAYRRIGSILTDGSSNIFSFTQSGNYFAWNDTANAICTMISGGPSTSYTSLACASPVGVRCKGDFAAHVYHAGSSSNLIVGHGDSTTGRTILISTTGNSGYDGCHFSAVTDTSSQIKYSGNSGDTLTIGIVGYKDITL